MVGFLAFAAQLELFEAFAPLVVAIVVDLTEEECKFDSRGADCGLWY